MIVGFSVGAALTAVGLPGEPWFNSIPIFAVPIAVGIAVLRYRLWDLDLVVDRTLTYGALAVVVTAIYVLMVAGVGALIGGGTRSDVGLAVLATAIAAAVFQPAREAAQAAVRRLVFRAPPDSAGVAVSIRTLGGFRVERAGRPVGTSEWQSKKARQLLKMLVARRGRPWHRERLIDALWPDADGGNLANRLAVAASTVRAVLDPDKVHPNDHFVTGDSDTLRLDPDHVSLDVEHFLATAEVGLRSKGSELEEAESMYRGDFLEEDLYEDWAQPLREEARPPTWRCCGHAPSASSNGGPTPPSSPSSRSSRSTRGTRLRTWQSCRLCTKPAATGRHSAPIDAIAAAWRRSG